MGNTMPRAKTAQQLFAYDTAGPAIINQITKNQLIIFLAYHLVKF